MQDWNLETNSPKALILHAHPDDETIFAGGLMLTHPSWHWFLVCLTMQIDTTRPEEYASAMGEFGRIGVNIESYQNLGKNDRQDPPLTTLEYNDWLKSVQDLNLDPDIVFTHNAGGEYGHPQHIAVHQIAKIGRA